MKKWQSCINKIHPFYFIIVFALLMAICSIIIFLPPSKSIYDDTSVSEVETHMRHNEKNKTTNEEEFWMQDQIKKIDEMEKTMKESISRKRQYSNIEQAQDILQVKSQSEEIKNDK